jgi:hydroxyacylglutathione hydrolase
MRHLINTSAAMLLALMALAVTVAGQQAGAPGSAPAVQNQTPGDGAPRIAPADVRAELDKGDAIIVDVRGDSSYEAGHVKGARLIPYSDLIARIDELPRDKMIITYCS